MKPPLPVHWISAGSGFARLGAYLWKKSGRLGKLPSTSPGKSQGNCRKLPWNTKRSGQARMNWEEFTSKTL